MRNTPRNFLFDLGDDEPFREATPEEVSAQWTAPMGVITVGGHKYYVDHYYGEDIEDSDWEDEWRQEIAREEGMLGGCDAYNDAMGY